MGIDGSDVFPVKWSRFFRFFLLEGIWNALPNSRGVVKTNLIKALLETRGCRWISYSNSKQYC